MDTILTGPTDHCHAPNLDLAPVLALKNKIRKRAAETEEPSSTILHSIMRSFPLDSASELLRSDSLLRTIRRQRQTEPVDAQNKLPAHLRKTDRGDDFVLHEEKDLVIFTTDANLAVLKNCKHWFADGTFSVRKHCSVDCYLFLDILGVSERILPNVHVAWLVQVTDHSIGLRTSHRKENSRL